jgi:hypothetical protein
MVCRVQDNSSWACFGRRPMFISRAKDHIIEIRVGMRPHCPGSMDYHTWDLRSWRQRPLHPSSQASSRRERLPRLQEVLWSENLGFRIRPMRAVAPGGSAVGEFRVSRLGVYDRFQVFDGDWGFVRSWTLLQLATTEEMTHAAATEGGWCLREEWPSYP